MKIVRESTAIEVQRSFGYKLYFVWLCAKLKPVMLDDI
jgi:hypothetical protein